MTALAADRIQRQKVFKSLRFPAAVDVYYQGALVCYDYSLGRAVVGQAGADLIPIGTVTDQTTITVDGASLNVTLLRPVWAQWFANSATDAVDAADLLKVAYVEDDQTVRETNTADGYSALGLVWAIDTVKGVLVETDPALAHVVARLAALEP